MKRNHRWCNAWVLLLTLLVKVLHAFMFYDVLYPATSPERARVFLKKVVAGCEPLLQHKAGFGGTTVTS